MHRTRFYWIIKRKLPKIHVLILGGGSCNSVQPCFRGRSVIFVPKGGGGPCVLGGVLGGGSCNSVQPCFRGRSVIFVPKGGGGPCVFYQPHFQILYF